MHILSTERLELQQMNLDDAPFIFELLNSPAWLKYIGDRGIKTITDAENYLSEKMLPAYENEGKGGWKVTLKSTGDTIGNCGFYQRDFLEMPDLGFAFLPQYIGKGYGYEAAKGCLDHAIKHWNLTECCAITSPANAASIGLLIKLGFQEAKKIKWPDSEEELLYFNWTK